MDQDLRPPPEKPGAFMLAAAAGGARWRAQLYVTLLFWRRKRGRSVHTACGASQGGQSPYVSRRNLTANAITRPPDDPWDRPRNARHRLRSCLVMAVLLLIAWTTADTAARLISRVDFERLLTGG